MRQAVSSGCTMLLCGSLQAVIQSIIFYLSPSYHHLFWRQLFATTLLATLSFGCWVL